jgi:hypothetical protein
VPKVSWSVCSLSGTRNDCPAMENHLRANGDTDESGAQGRATALFSSKRIDTISCQKPFNLEGVDFNLEYRCNQS